MCGILGLATTAGRQLSIDPRAVERMRDTMARRGPDGAGLWQHQNFALAHRRLVVVDPSPGGHQPMVSACGRYALVYNGELYNDAELRDRLAGLGRRFRSASDTETVLEALIAWGPGALGRLRGMYALGLADTREQTLLLARDPLGIKPLYWTLAELGGGPELVFASEPRAILAHPRFRARPDLQAISGYLTTIRTVLGERTLFDGVRTLRPGRAVRFSLGGVSVRRDDLPETPWPEPPVCGPDAAASTRVAVRDAVHRHLRSDVPICCLLSGGLDSSIIAATAAAELPELHTYCSGAALDQPPPAPDDFAAARLVAERLGTTHTEAPVSRELFRERWPEMIAAMGLPLSTPNEVAINEVARALRGRGHIVALSGEGADELFAGYDAPMMDAAVFEGVPTGRPHALAAAAAGVQDPGHFQLLVGAWVPPASKGAILDPEVHRGLEGDGVLLDFYRDEFARFAAECEGGQGPERLQPHLRFLRRINLAGLLQRLDTATMLASVEGRTPFADVAIAALAESLPVSEKITLGPGAPETKRVLRRAFAAELPELVLTRAKASFPLPMPAWVADVAPRLRESPFARALFNTAAIETVAANASQLWQLAWPMVNLSLWGDLFWG